jgi:hypothetical protein
MPPPEALKMEITNVDTKVAATEVENAEDIEYLTKTKASIIPSLTDSESVGIIIGSFAGLCLLIVFIRRQMNPQALDSTPVSSKNLENELIKTDHGPVAPLKAGAPGLYREDSGPADETDDVVFGLPIPGTSPASTDNTGLSSRV